MEKVSIKYKTQVVTYLNDLIFTLFKEDYFSYLESSVDYKNKLIDFIDSNIATFPARKTPLRIRYLGSNYIFYKSNQRTTWYVFFEQKDKNYIITNTINNNSTEVNWL